MPLAQLCLPCHPAAFPSVCHSSPFMWFCLSCDSMLHILFILPSCLCAYVHHCLPSPHTFLCLVPFGPHHISSPVPHAVRVVLDAPMWFSWTIRCRCAPSANHTAILHCSCLFPPDGSFRPHFFIHRHLPTFPYGSHTTLRGYCARAAAPAATRLPLPPLHHAAFSRRWFTYYWFLVTPLTRILVHRSHNTATMDAQSGSRFTGYACAPLRHLLPRSTTAYRLTYAFFARFAASDL